MTPFIYKTVYASGLSEIRTFEQTERSKSEQSVPNTKMFGFQRRLKSERSDFGRLLYFKYLWFETVRKYPQKVKNRLGRLINSKLQKISIFPHCA